MVSDEPENSTNRETIVELAAKGRIPAIYPLREFVEVGGLMAYSIDLVDTFRRGRELHNQGEYLLAQEILNKLVQAEPQNQAAKDLLADVFEQVGYQQENPGLRNSFLAAAYELRSGIPQEQAVKSSSPDVIRGMSTELFLNFLGIRMAAARPKGCGSRST